MTDAYSGNAYSDQPKKQKAVSENGLKAVIAHLKKTVSRMSIKRRRSTWIDYYSDNSYSDEAFAQKKAVVLRYVEKVKPQTVWDLGANTGEFSRIAAQFDARTLAFDIDPQCNEENYQLCQQEDEQRLLPLFLDLANPTPSIGWAHRERHSLAERGPADLILALALVHHLAISNNLPFGHIAEYFSRLTDNLIMEFVPKEDPQVKRLLRVRKDIFQDYTEQAFESAFAEYFHIKERQAVGTDGRAVYLMARKNTAVSAKGIARYEIA